MSRPHRRRNRRNRWNRPSAATRAWPRSRRPRCSPCITPCSAADAPRTPAPAPRAPPAAARRRRCTVSRVNTAIVGARVIPVTGEPIDGGTVLFDAGKIVAVEGPGFAVPADAEVVDGAGKWVLPGFIDAHAHLGLHEEAEGWAGSDVNEMTRPVTA